MVNKRTSIKPPTIKMSNAAQYKPMTRGKLAKFLKISTATLIRFCKRKGIEFEPRVLLRPDLVKLIIETFNGTLGVSH